MDTHKVAKTRRTVRLTMITMSMYLWSYTLLMWLIVRRMMVGMKTVRMLLMSGLPRLMFTSTPSYSPIDALHMMLLFTTYWVRSVGPE